MFKWNGPAYKGAMRDRRKQKRQEAEARNAVTATEKRARDRRKQRRTEQALDKLRVHARNLRD